MPRDLLTTIKAARRVSTPLICVRTPDPASTMSLIQSGFNGSQPPIFAWNIIQGITARNEPAQDVISSLIQGDPAMVTGNPAEALTVAQKLPERSVLFFQNAHRFVGNEAVAQAIWLLRDLYKQDRRTLILLCPSLELPSELSQDVLIIDEPLPGPDRLEQIVRDTYSAAGVPAPDAATVKQAVDATCGLAAFPAEQVTAMSMTSQGVDLDSLWLRKIQMVEQIPGLRVYKGTETFDDLGGLSNIKEFFRAYSKGKRPPKVVVFVDEIEKMLAGSEGDTSGTSQMQLGKFLTWTQEKNSKGEQKVVGALLLGHPGCGKSAICKALGNESGILTIALDLGDTKNSLVGASEERLSNALKTIDAVGGDDILVIATCNSIAKLRPEFIARFQLGLFFFDLPDADEREGIWRIYGRKFGIDTSLDKRPADEGWVGREIESCCYKSYLLDISLREAAKYTVPGAVANQEGIQALRSQANGRYISASFPGPYRTYRAAESARDKARPIEVE